MAHLPSRRPAPSISYLHEYTTFELGGSVSVPIGGILSLEAGTEWTIATGDNRFQGRIYSGGISAGPPGLPVGAHGQVTFSNVTNTWQGAIIRGILGPAGSFVNRVFRL